MNISASLAQFSCAVFLLSVTPAFAQPQAGQEIPKAQVAERVKRFDANQDGQITREEFKGPAFVFKTIVQTDPTAKPWFLGE